MVCINFYVSILLMIIVCDEMEKMMDVILGRI